MNTVPITISFGDGAGTDIMMSCLRILQHIKAPLRIHTLELGTRAFQHGFPYGIPSSCMDKIMEHKILLCAPTAPPDNPKFRMLSIPDYLECSTIITSNLQTEHISLSPQPYLQGIAYLNTEAGYGVFEPNHGFLPELADKNIANPCGIIIASILMLQYIGQSNNAQIINNALTSTLSSGYRTPDLISSSNASSVSCVSTSEFTDMLLYFIDNPVSFTESLFTIPVMPFPSIS